MEKSVLFPRLGLYEKAVSNNLSWDEKLELARSSGFDFLEMSIDATAPRLKRLYNKAEVFTVRHAVEQAGFFIQTLALTANRGYPLGSEDPAVREKGIELVERAIAFANAAGIRLIHLAAYDELGEKGNPHTEKLFYESIFHCEREAASAGVLLALETMDTSFMCSIERIMKVVRMLDSPYLQCYADIGNLTASGLDPEQELLLAGRHLIGIHLKDTRPGIYRDIPFGEGTVDFDCCLKTLSKMQYTGFMVAEMWSYDDEAYHAYLPKAQAFLRERMNRLGNNKGDHV